VRTDLGERWQQIDPPETEPVSLTEAKAHLRVDITDDDNYILGLIAAARSWVETHLSRALITQSWRVVLDAFPPGPRGWCQAEPDPMKLYTILLPKGRVGSVGAVAYTDTAGASQSVAEADYILDNSSDDQFARLFPALGKTWPATAELPGSVQIEFDVGYGQAVDVPADIRQAIKLLLGSLYEHRESEVTGTITTQLEHGLEMLLAPYRLNTFE